MHQDQSGDPAMTKAERTEDTPEHRAVAERVASILRDRIVKGQLKPRDRIVERKISAELNLSRTPVREALKLLHADGLVDLSRNRGAQVTDYSAEEAEDLFDVIAALESLAARRLVARLDAGLMARLEDLHAQILAHHQDGRAEAYFDTNSEIHDLIVSEGGNTVLTETHQRMMARARRGRFLAILEPERLEQAVAEHETLMEALRVRDADQAAAIWHQHLRHTGETVAANLRGRAHRDPNRADTD